MLRFALLFSTWATALLAVAGVSTAQDDPADRVDFILRPTAGADDDGAMDDLDDFWGDAAPRDEGGRPEGRLPPGGASAEPVLGPPLAGPSADTPVGPPLTGPFETADRTDPALRPVAVRGEDADPFAASGIDAGVFIIRPAIEIGVSATDNAEGTSDGDGAIGLLVEPEVNIRSEDDRHSVAVDLRGAAILYGDNEIDEREAEARLTARYDLTRRTSIEAAAGYSYDLDRYTDPDTPDAATERPSVEDLTASLGFTRSFGRLAAGLTGSFERNTHGDVEVAGGDSVSREELDNDQYGLRLRTSYRASGALSPFAEVAGGWRDYDIERDSNGFERSGRWGELRGGIAFDLGAKFRGEAALGYRREEPEDDSLEAIDAVIADAAVFWSPRRMWEVRFDLSTDVRATSLAGASGSVLYSGTLSAARRFHRFRVEAGIGLDYERFVGVDREETTTFAFTSLSYALSRRASLIGRYSFEHLDSSEPDEDSTANVVGVRLRLQR